jgi:hypothetical protein
MFNPDAGLPRINRGMVYLGTCLIAGFRLAQEQQVTVRVVPFLHCAGLNFKRRSLFCKSANSCRTFATLG